MNHSGIISTSQSQQGIQNVCVRVYVCVRITSILSWQRAQPFSLLPHFSLSSSLPPWYSPGETQFALSPSLFPPHLAHHQRLVLGGSQLTSPPLPLLFYKQQILTGCGKITVGLRLNMVQLQGFL